MVKENPPERYNEPLPVDWSAGIGESSTEHYDMWYHRDDDKYELHIYWDRGNPYTVELIPINGFDKFGDPNYGCVREVLQFDTLKKAEESAWSLMGQFSESNGD